MAMHPLLSHTGSLLLLLAFLVAPLAAGEPWEVCGSSGDDFAPNSTYQSNLGLLSATVPKNASSSPALFATGSAGAPPDTAYALALCRGDVANATACEACVAVAFQDAQQLCAYSREVTIYYDLCYLRFSGRDFLADAGDNDARYFTRVRNVSAPAEVFDAAVGALLNATADHAAASSPVRRFATGVEAASGGSVVPVVYALAQCTPDMSPADCRSCLANVIQLLPEYFSGSPSGRVIGVRCNYRYELYPFFSGSPMVQLQAPADAGPPPAQAPANMAAPPATRGGRKRRAAKISAFVACSIVLMLIASGSVFVCLKRRKAFRNHNMPAISMTTPTMKKIDNGKCAIFDLTVLQHATGNFSENNKLGEGGFGTVYKGKLSNGQEIAVKKLSQTQCSREGLNQLHNEVQVLAELQHKKLVRLLGFCSHLNETMLVYEHIQNGSLDNLLFDNSEGKILNWEQRYNIILGIAKGILYLHEDSRKRIIHRDLKANNILLDENMNPKIADFGLARLLRGGHTQTKTTNVAGTYGYMAPEYAVFGKVSPKIDIFSFGVLVLEIVTGRRNSSSNSAVNLLSEVWNCWTTGTILQLADRLLDGYPNSKLLQCIHIGLLCVEVDPDDRPSISSVIVMLTRSRILQPPRQPAFFFGTDSSSSVSDQHKDGNYMYEKSGVIVEDNVSVNDVTNTDPYPR